METFVREPNLPRGRVTLAALSARAERVREALAGLGCAVLAAEPCGALLPAVDAHADMLCHPLGGRDVVAARGNARLFESLAAAGVAPRWSERELQPSYPGDVLLNAAEVGRFCFGSAHCDESLRAAWEERGQMFVPVRQGYAKCSTAIVSREAVVTADPSIAKAAAGCGLDVLRIREGFVELPGFSFGFLGGACGKLSRDTLAFAGDLRTHPDCAAIEAFLRSHGVFALSLCGGPLRDVGGILPLREEEGAD